MTEVRNYTPELLKLKKKIFIKGEIEVVTGLHIGGSSLGLSIGGPDQVVVRNPVTNLPYIPGSSLKGKMRSLVEKSLGLVKIKPEKKKEKGKEKIEWVGKLCDDPDYTVAQLFGYPAEQGGQKSDHGPTRLIVRDAELINEEELANAEDTDMYCTEIKTEVSIDRLTSKANPRNFERVPAGARFSLNLIIDVYNIDLKEYKGEHGGMTRRADEFVSLVRQALELLEDDYLGGHGSRGYGQVRFRIKEVKERTAEAYRTRKLEYEDSKDYAPEFERFMVQ